MREGERERGGGDSTGETLGTNKAKEDCDFKSKGERSNGGLAVKCVLF